MANKFPTKYELRCAGISFILGHILISAAWALASLQYDVYEVKNDEDVIKLHNALSDPSYRVKTELAVTCLWIAFPLLLIGLFGIKKNASIWFKSTSGEMYVYLFEKAYIIWITMAMVIIPAIQLVIVSYDWSFDEPISDPSGSTVSVPSGYYIQLFLNVLQFEIFDCMCIADGVFMISLWILGMIMVHGAYAKKQKDSNAKWRSYLLEMQRFNNIFIIKALSCCCCISSVIIFLVLLFEFAESGFFSITGHAKFLLIWIFICKMFIGSDLIYSSTDKKYRALKKIYEQQQETEDVLNESNVNDENYQMEQININTENNDEL